MIEKPIYIVLGLLDSGKTSLIKDTLYNPAFTEDERTMIIACEMGDEEYDKHFLKDTNSFLIELNGIKDLTIDKMRELEANYEFDRIFLEANGSEDMLEYLSKHGLINNWEIAQILATFDASMFKLQLRNMNQFIYDIIKISECTIFNRFNRDDYLFIRNNALAVNPKTELIFENPQNEIEEFDDFELFDLSQPHVDIKDIDYGDWYNDVVDNPDKYNGVHIGINVKYFEKLRQYESVYILGRRAMVCCDNDIQSLGLTCIFDEPYNFTKEGFYHIEGRLKTMEEEDGFKTCLLYVDKAIEIEPLKDDLVYFN